MAEFILKDLVRKKKISGEFVIESRATSSEEIWGGRGNPMYPPAAAELRLHGIEADPREATQLRRDDYEKYDLFIGMDRSNIRNMHNILGGDPKGKIKKLLEYCGSPADVNAPWYTDRFDIAYKDIYRGCVALLESLGVK